MTKLLSLRPIWILLLYLAIDTVCIGMGMGVPIFCILLGFPTGWFIMQWVVQMETSPLPVLRRALIYAILSITITMLGMVIIWAPSISMLFEPGSDLANFGIPMILYEPEASFIGWLVLMILISPFLQLLTTLSSSYLAFMRWLKATQGIMQVN